MSEIGKPRFLTLEGTVCRQAGPDRVVGRDFQGGGGPGFMPSHPVLGLLDRIDETGAVGCSAPAVDVSVKKLEGHGRNEKVNRTPVDFCMPAAIITERPDVQAIMTRRGE